MLLVILGAGASYDSDPNAPAVSIQGQSVISPHVDRMRPPLTRDLFDVQAQWASLLGQHPVAAPLVLEVQARMANGSADSLESVLRSLLDEADTYVYRKVQATAMSFLLQNIIHDVTTIWEGSRNGLTTYALMVDRIRRWQAQTGGEVTYVSFNYDLLLETAMQSRTDQSSTGSANTLSSEPSVFKPHGSVDWARVKQRPQNLTWQTSADAQRRWILESAFQEAADDEWVMRSPGSDPAPVGDRQIYLPAIAIPVEAKDEYQCPPAQIAALKARLAEVDNILAIGWRGAERNFISLLAENLSPGVDCHVVSESEESAANAWGNISAIKKIGRFATIGGGFSRFLTEGDQLERVLAGEDGTTERYRSPLSQPEE